jgi:hypothetical protein
MKAAVTDLAESRRRPKAKKSRARDVPWSGIPCKTRASIHGNPMGLGPLKVPKTGSSLKKKPPDIPGEVSGGFEGEKKFWPFNRVVWND